MAYEPIPPPDEQEPLTDVPIDEPEVEPAVTVDVAVSGMAPESVNIARTLTEAKQKEYAELVCHDYETDWDSSDSFRKRRTKIFKLAVGDIPPPRDGEKFRLARIHYPIIMTAVLRIGARIYDQQFPSNGEFFGVKPTDATDLERSIRVAKHLNWQVTHQVPEYVPNHDILIEQCLLYGSAFSYIYRDPKKDRTCHEACRTEDIVLPYKRHSSDPSLADMPRITRKLRLYKHELKAKGNYYINVDKVYDDVAAGLQSTGETDGKTTGEMQEAVDKEAGYEKPSNDPGAPRLLLEQHRWLDIDGTGDERPVIVVVDYGTKNLLSLTLREDEDPEDRARYNREKEASDAMFQAAMEKYAADMAEYEMGRMMSSMGAPAMTPTAPPVAGEQTMTAPPTPGATDSTVPMVNPAMPQPPPKPADPSPPKMVPINFFTHFICFPNPEGVYGLGIGTLLEGHNVAADTLASQFVDAATLSNTATGLASRQAKLRGGDIEISPGKVNRTDLSTADLKDGISWIKFSPPEQAMRQLIGDMIQEAEKLSGANEILSGEVGGSNETATTTQIRISQAMASITIMNKRYTRARTFEGQKFARLNSVYLGDQEYFSTVDPSGPLPMEPTEIGRRDYLQDCDITITADPRMASQPQRFQEAVQAWEFVNSSPVLAQNIALVMACAKNIFQAMDRPDLLQAFMQGMPMMGAMGGMPGGQPGQPAPPPNGQSNGAPKPEGPMTVPNGGNQPANGQAPEGQVA